MDMVAYLYKHIRVEHICSGGGKVETVELSELLRRKARKLSEKDTSDYFLSVVLWYDPDRKKNSRHKAKKSHGLDSCFQIGREIIFIPMNGRITSTISGTRKAEHCFLQRT